MPSKDNQGLRHIGPEGKKALKRHRVRKTRRQASKNPENAPKKTKFEGWVI